MGFSTSPCLKWDVEHVGFMLVALWLLNIVGQGPLPKNSLSVDFEKPGVITVTFQSVYIHRGRFVYIFRVVDRAYLFYSLLGTRLVRLL